MKLDRRRLKEQIHELYRSEHEAMGERGKLERLERAREGDLAPTLAAGGVAVFPHAGVLDCGHQVAAAVHGCLDSGADRVVEAKSDARDAGRVFRYLRGELKGQILDMTYTDASELSRLRALPGWLLHSSSGSASEPPTQHARTWRANVHALTGFDRRPEQGFISTGSSRSLSVRLSRNAGGRARLARS